MMIGVVSAAPIDALENHILSYDGIDTGIDLSKLNLTEDAACIGFYHAASGQCWGYCHACELVINHLESSIKVKDVSLDIDVHAGQWTYTALPDNFEPPEEHACYGFLHKASGNCIGIQTGL
ncbi:hypothetical protein FDK38_005126 [Candidozyma auris]|nr:hypothetical protein FDK38_005126 [[Candida] auris]